MQKIKTVLISFIFLAIFLCAPLFAQSLPCTTQAAASELPLSGCNRAFSIHVLNTSVQEILGDKPAPEGFAWLVLDLRFDNWNSADLIFKLDKPEALLVGSLRRQLYLLINGNTVVRPELPQQAPSEDSFVLPRIGATQAVSVAYLVPTERCESMVLSYHHEDYADIKIPLQGTLPQESQPLSELQNDVMALGLFAVDVSTEYRGHRAPAGMQWLVVDIRGQSRWRTEINALGVDAKASTTAKTNHSRVMEYIGADTMLQVVVDGTYAYLPLKQFGTLANPPAWLTYAYAGGESVYAIPNRFERLELVAYFGTFVAPGIANRHRPPLRFDLTAFMQKNALKAASIDQSANPADVKFLIADKPLPLTVHGTQKLQTYAGIEAVAEESLLLVDMSLENPTEENGTMLISERLTVSTNTQSKVKPLGLFLPGATAFAEPFLLPSAESRRFYVLFHVAANAEVELSYAGISLNETRPLFHGD